MVIYFYRPNSKTPLWVKLWYRLFKPRFTHCNIQLGEYVYDLGQDAPTITKRREALELRTPSMGHRLPDEVEAGSIWDLSSLRATPIRSALHVLGRTRPRTHNCASFISLILQSAWPTFPLCYTPDELEQRLARFKPHPSLHETAFRLAQV